MRRINYSLWDLLNNIIDSNNHNMALAMYPGVEMLLEFPKGVREKHESNFDCAVREFFEETSIKLKLENVELLAVLDQQYTAGNNKEYSITYYVLHSEINNTLNTVLLNINTSAVLGDNCNVLIWTKWIYIRKHFVSSNLLQIVNTLDNLFALQVQQ